MDTNDEPELDIKQVIIHSESDEWSDYNDSKEGESREDNCVNNCNVQLTEIQSSENNDNGKVFCHTYNKGKRKFVSMETKLEAIRKLDQGEKVRKVASELGVGEVTVGDWRRNRARIEKWCMEKCSEDASSSRKTMKRSDFEKTSEALFLWFSQERLKGFPISGPMLQEKALYFHKQLQDGDGSFTASVGWLDRWKKRYGIRRLTMCGEKLSLDLEAVETFQNKLHSFIKDENLTADQLYNCDETGLKYKTLPSLPRQENPFLDYQKRKERVTILACCNASGQNKLPLMLIGKACYLEPLKNISSSELPVTYKINKSSIIDRDIFKEWFYNEFVPKIEQFLKNKNLPRKAILILDSASSHPSEEELVSDGIRTLFLPPTYTSLLQPMSQGILFCFKVNYRKKLFEYLFKLKEKDFVITYLKNINLKDIVNHMADAWSEIPCEMLIRSWKKLLTNSETLDEIEDSEGKAYLISLIQKLPGYEYVDENVLLQWFEQDDSYEVLGNYTTEPTNDESGGEIDSSKFVQNGVKQNKAFYVKGLAAMDLALHYVQLQEEATPDDILIFKKWKDFAEKKLSQFQK